MEQRGRRWQQIPVFGEWNQLQCEAELPMTQYFESAMQAGLVVRAGHRCYHDAAAAGEVVLFRSSSSGSPPPHKPAKKVRSSGMEGGHQEEQVHAVSSRRRQQGPLAVADGGPRAARRPCRVVRSVDDDLYKVHPDLLPKKGKGRKHVRSLWMGCVGLNCVA
ncbi:unnamed protein product [Urochloa decumbens]|uniref:Uncharacterized protein n=1 Tax=Urochloa decumbens TaxID=240449 RepID=A0ABC8WCW7_9POAL